jgi:UDP-glucose 4-epimerase
MPGVAWITGGAGFIGTAVARRFHRDDWTVLGLDRRTPEAGHPLQFTCVGGDISAASLKEALARTGSPDVIFHGAGTPSVGRAAADPESAAVDTVESARITLEFMKTCAPAAVFIVPSSAAVYGAAGDAALCEALPPRPISHYGNLKLQVEQLCEAASRSYGPSTVVIRFFSVYGPGLRKQLPWELGNRILSGESPIDLAGSGHETRDFLHVDDAADLVWRVGRSSGHRIINGGSGTSTSVHDFAQGLAKACGRAPKFRFTGDDRPNDPKHYLADIAEARSLGWAPKIPLAEGLISYAAWLRRI